MTLLRREQSVHDVDDHLNMRHLHPPFYAECFARKHGDLGSGFLLLITGLLGGHSGLNIAENRGNAVKMAAEVLYAVFDKYPEARLAQLTAGDKRNALPREAVATIFVLLRTSFPDTLFQHTDLVEIAQKTYISFSLMRHSNDSPRQCLTVWQAIKDMH